VYILVSIANWCLLALSFVLWASQGLRWLWRAERPEPEAAWLLWLFFAAFALQGALSVLADASGALSSNLQIRLFPSFSIVAAAVVGTAMARWKPRRLAPPVYFAVVTVFFTVPILSVLKATNEPLLSNKWTFYRASELTALDWSVAHLQQAEIWTEFDERLIVAYYLVRGDPGNGNSLFNSFATPATRYMLVSPATRFRSIALDVPLPVPDDALQVYDNGETQLYYRRPQTPYQR
jgi:hypothetical protein